MPSTKPAFIFVHGGFVCKSIWRLVIPLLEARGHVARALDLPGSGAHAKVPVAYWKRPLDAKTFATEPSPKANITQEERTQSVSSLAEETPQETADPAALVGHALGDLTVAAATQATRAQ